MIERIGLRAAEFVGRTAGRVAGAAEELVADRRSSKSRLLKVVVPAVAGGAAAVAATASAVARERGGSSSKPPSKKSTSRSTGSSARSNGNQSTAKTAKDKVLDLTEKTRDELYELAKKADVPGRSTMTRDELAKALKK